MRSPGGSTFGQYPDRGNHPSHNKNLAINMVSLRTLQRSKTAAKAAISGWDYPFSTLDIDSFTLFSLPTE